MTKIKIDKGAFQKILEALRKQDNFQCGAYPAAEAYWAVGRDSNELGRIDRFLGSLSDDEFQRFVEGDEEALKTDDGAIDMRNLPNGKEAWSLLDDYFEDSPDWRKP